MLQVSETFEHVIWLCTKAKLFHHANCPSVRGLKYDLEQMQLKYNSVPIFGLKKIYTKVSSFVWNGKNLTNQLASVIDPGLVLWKENINPKLFLSDSTVHFQRSFLINIAEDLPESCSWNRPSKNKKLFSFIACSTQKSTDGKPNAGET